MTNIFSTDAECIRREEKMIIIIGMVIFIGILILIKSTHLVNVHSNYIDETSQFREMYRQYGTYIASDTADLVQRTGKFEEGYEVSELVKEESGIEYVYAKSTDTLIDGKLLYIVVKNNNYSFGKKKIKIGSSKEDVEKLMVNSKRPKPSTVRFAYYDSNNNEVVTNADVYCDDDYSLSVGFVYDKNNCVDVIYIGAGPNL